MKNRHHAAHVRCVLFSNDPINSLYGYPPLPEEGEVLFSHWAYRIRETLHTKAHIDIVMNAWAANKRTKMEV